MHQRQIARVPETFRHSIILEKILKMKKQKEKSVLKDNDHYFTISTQRKRFFIEIIKH